MYKCSQVEAAAAAVNEDGEEVEKTPFTLSKSEA